MKLRMMNCKIHGSIEWAGDVVCDVCSKIHMFPDIPQFCSCKVRLAPVQASTRALKMKFSACPICPRCSGRILPWWSKVIRFIFRRGVKK